MDSLTHIVLGACIGEAFIGKNIGKKAMVWGALAQSLPDIDILASLWMSPAANLLAHRGFTHSFLFVCITFPMMALLADRWHRPHNIKMSRWLWFFGIKSRHDAVTIGTNNHCHKTMDCTLGKTFWLPKHFNKQHLVFSGNYLCF